MDGPLQQCVGQNEALWLCGVPLSGGKHRLTPEKATAASRKARSPLLARPRSVSLWRLAAPEPRLRRAGGCARSYRRRRCCCRCGRPLPTLIGIERKVPTDPLDTNTSLARSSQKLPPDERNATVASGLFGAGSIETVHAYRPPNRGHRPGRRGRRQEVGQGVESDVASSGCECLGGVVVVVLVASTEQDERCAFALRHRHV